MRKNHKLYTTLNVLKADMGVFQKLKMQHSLHLPKILSDYEFFKHVIKNYKERG